jgi:hypothetical protein
LSIRTIPLSIDVGKKWHKERKREREREGVLKSCFFDPLLYKTPTPLFFLVP